MKPIILLVLLSAANLHGELPSPLDSLSSAQQKSARRHEDRLQRLRHPSGPAKFGDPLIGLNKAQTAAFTTGLDEFTNGEDADGGLGPIFNNSSCISCHGVPSAGGSSTLTVTRFGHASSTLIHSPNSGVHYFNPKRLIPKSKKLCLPKPISSPSINRRPSSDEGSLRPFPMRPFYNSPIAQNATASLEKRLSPPN